MRLSCTLAVAEGAGPLPGGGTVKFDEPSRVEEVSMTVDVAHADV